MLDLAAQIDEVSESLEWGHEIGNVLAEIITKNRPMSEQEVATVAAFRTHLRLRSGGWTKVESSPGLDSLQHVEPTAWVDVERLLSVLTAALAITRLGDVLWHLRLGEKPHRSGIAALNAHIDLIESADRHYVELGHSCQRAADLTLGLGQSPDIPFKVIAGLLSDVGAGDGEVSLGVLCVESLARLAQDQTHTHRAAEDLEQLVSDPHLLERLAEAKQSVRPDLGHANFDAAIQAFESFASSGDAMHQFIFTQEALRIAQDVGHPRRAAIRAAMQKMDAFADAEPFRFEQQLDGALLDRMAQEIVGHDSIEAALARLQYWATGIDTEAPPAGGERTLLDAISSNVLGQHGSTTRKFDSANKSTMRKVTAMMMSSHFVPALDRCFVAYRPTREHLTPLLLGHAQIDESSARVLADGLILFGERRYEPAASTIIPRVEQVVRKLAVALDLVVTKDPAGERRGGVKSLGDLLRGLQEEGLPVEIVSLAQRLEFFLSDDVYGFNLRNTTLHGLSEQAVQAWEAAIAVLCLLDIIFASEDGVVTTASDGTRRRGT